MSNPFDTDNYMTYVCKRTDDMPFNPKLTMDNGQAVEVVAASIYHETLLSSRLSYLLRELLWRDEVTTEMLNKIGLSRQDAEAIGIQMDGLENVNPPINWEDDL